jgi:DNA adenine methylase
MFERNPDSSGPTAKPAYSRPGGKTRMLKHILPLIPPHTCYCEPFFGGGAVFFAKPPSHLEVINDIDQLLVAFCRNAKLHLDALLAEMDFVLNSRQEFEDYGRQEGLTEIQRSARWFIRNRLSFGGMGGTFAISKTQPLSSRNQRILAIQSMSRRLDRTTIENRSWEKIFDTYDHAESFWFLDPPYFDSGGEAYAGWSEHELQRFCTRVHSLRGPWIVTFQDCAQIRDLLTGFQVKAITRQNGIGNRGGKKGRVYREVIITSERDEFTAARKGATAS